MHVSCDDSMSSYVTSVLELAGVMRAVAVDVAWTVVGGRSDEGARIGQVIVMSSRAKLVATPA